LGEIFTSQKPRKPSRAVMHQSVFRKVSSHASNSVVGLLIDD
jgi:hypothetical protein